MTMHERQRRRRKERARRRAKRLAAWTAFYGFELLVAAIPALVLAAVLIPATYDARGKAGMGGEWLAIGIVFWLAYTAVHKWVCKRIFEKVER